MRARQRTVAVMQPYFLPHRPYYSLIRKADVFVILDDVQFCRGWQQRNRILLPDGRKRWITIPVHSDRPARQRIDQVRICRHEPWADALLAQVERAYRNHPGFDETFPELADLLSRPGERLVDVTLPILRWSAARAAAPSGDWPLSSELGGRALQASERLLRLCRHFAATTYLSGPAARGYLDVELFRRNGIDVVWHRSASPEYPQMGRGPFDPLVSILDLFMNCGSASSRYA